MNMLTKVYISCPMAEYKRMNDIATSFREVANKYKKLYHLSWWVHGTNYNPNVVDDCDIFIVQLPSNSFNFSIETLPRGTKNEVLRAIQLNKKILLSYKRTGEDGYCFYKVRESSSAINGIPGTADDFLSYFDNSFKEKVAEIRSVSYGSKLENFKIEEYLSSTSKPKPPKEDSIKSNLSLLLLRR